MAQDLDLRTRFEIETLHEVLDEVDFYALLQVPKTAGRPEIEQAFAKESRRFHPDAYFGVRDPHFLRKITAIYRKSSEAYSVLKDPELKARYDSQMGIAGPDANKKELEEELEEAKAAEDEVCKTRQGRRYYDLAMTSKRNNDFNSMAMNLHFALSFERGNAIIEEQLAEAKAVLEEKKAKQAFKVRLR